MSSTERVAELSSAFRQLSDALHLASVACKDLEYTIPLLATKALAIVPATPANVPSVTSAEKGKRKKDPKDPNEPRRPPSAYLLFTAKARQDVVASDPDLKPAEIMTKLAVLWSELDENKRRVRPHSLRNSF
jgi:hypothetical protein